MNQCVKKLACVSTLFLLLWGFRPGAGAAPWQLQVPFDPATQDTVVASGLGIHGHPGESQAAAVFQNKIYFTISADGSASPAKIYCFDPEAGTTTLLLTSSTYQFWALQVMNDALYISHLNGQLWRYDGTNVEEQTMAPFAANNSVTAMAAFNGKMYFGTSYGNIYETTDGQNFISQVSMAPLRSILALAPWQGYLYAANAEGSSYSSKIYRSADGSDWAEVGRFGAYSFFGFAAATDFLYLASVESDNPLGVAIRTTSDGTNWTRIFQTDTEGTVWWGHPAYFSQIGKVFFTSSSPSQSPQSRLFPARAGVVENRTPLLHGFASLVEANGKLYGIGAEDPNHMGSSGYVISLLGNYSQANLPPVAQCRDQVVAAGPNCFGEVSIDAGSYDPEGMPLLITQSPPGPYVLGQTLVTLTVTDALGASNTCTATVTVVDNSPPFIAGQPNITTTAEPGQCAALVEYTLPNTSDNCPGVNVDCQPAAGSSFPPGVTTVSCTATDAAGNTASTSFTITVTPTQALSITCPANMVLEFEREAGAVATFSPVASAGCASVATVCLPPSGTLFPIGNTEVHCTASDASGSSTSCAFSVTVQGARGLKQNVLAELQLLLSTATTREDRKKIAEAIEDLTQSLEPSLWQDETHLQARHGHKIFKEDKEVIDGLSDLIQSKKSRIADEILQGLVDRILRADRLLAVFLIEDATTAGAKPKKLADGYEQLAEGDEEIAQGEFEDALKDYQEAWKEALHLLREN